MTDNPWITRKRQVVYDNPWIHVEEHQVVNPSGGDGIYGVISFKNKAIGIIPIDDQGFTYLVGQYRYPLQRYSWEIPEGGGPIGEQPLLAAKRELKEETGYTAEHWRLLARLHLSNSVTDEEALIYIAEGLTPGQTEFEETEQIELRRIHLKDALLMVMDGSITDAISVAALLRLSVDPEYQHRFTPQ